MTEATHIKSTIFIVSCKLKIVQLIDHGGVSPIALICQVL